MPAAVYSASRLDRVFAQAQASGTPRTITNGTGTWTNTGSIVARVRFLSLEEWPLYWLRDWSEMARVARDCLAEIETGLAQQPANSELLLRRAVANTFLGIVAQREGRSPEAIALLQPAIETIGAAPTVHSAYELPGFMGFAR